MPFGPVPVVALPMTATPGRKSSSRYAENEIPALRHISAVATSTVYRILLQNRDYPITPYRFTSVDLASQA